MQFLNKISIKWKILISVFLILLNFYFVGITVYAGEQQNIDQISNWIKYSWSPVIWGTINFLTLVTIGGYLFKIYKRLLKRQIDMDTLIGVAAHILFVFSLINTLAKFKNGWFGYEVFWEASTLLICFSYIGRLLELKLRNQSVEGYKELLKLKKQSVQVIKKGKIVTLSIDKVVAGDLIVVKKGEIIPIDGILKEGKAIIDNSNITGESKPQNALKGTEIISGSLNTGSKIVIKATCSFEESTIYIIIDKAEDLSMVKPDIQKFADKILKIFLPGVFAISILAFIIWIILGYGFNITLPWFPKAEPYEIAILTMVTVLAISCPCALGVATPLIVTLSATESSKNNLLFSNAAAFEKIKEVGIIAFDKTGTLTTGEMKVVNYKGNKKILDIAGSIETHSNHPIAKAIYNEFPSKLKIKNVKEIHGKGMQAKYNDKLYELSKSSLHPETKGATVIEVFENKKSVARIEVIDVIKPNAHKLIKWLNKNKIDVAMITGDSKFAAKRVADQLGITQYFFDTKPQQKQEIIKELKEKTNKQVMFIGDGFNDILAIQEADISMSFSTGSDITNSMADISILNNNLMSIARAIKLSSMTKRTVVSTLCWAFIFNGLAIPIAFVLLVLPWIAALLMLASDLAVTINAFVFKARVKNKLKRIG